MLYENQPELASVPRVRATMNGWHRTWPVKPITDEAEMATRTRSRTTSMIVFKRTKSQMRILHENKQKRDGFRMLLSSNRFVWCWGMILIVRSCSIAFLTAMAWFYYWLFVQKDLISYLLADMRFDISYDTVLKLNWLVVGVDSLQIFFLLRSLLRTVMAGELTFGRENRRSRATVVSVSEEAVGKRLLPEDRPPPEVAEINITSAVLGFLKRYRVKYLDSVLFIHGKYFDDYFFARENLEVMAQIYQAFRLSVYVPTAWINHLCVAMICLNCASTPVIYWWIPASNTPLRRLVSLVCSSFLNFINSVVIPLVIFWPYVQKYENGYFPTEYIMDDVWYAKAISENQQLFVTSYLDFFTTLMPHWSLMTCLLTCEDLLARQQGESSTNRPESVQIPSTFSDANGLVKTRPLMAPCTVLCRFKDLALRNMPWLAGIAVLVMHVHAQQLANVQGCRLFTSPWLTSKSSCVVMNVNCYRLGIDGNQQQIHDVLVHVNHETLYQLVFTHCPKLAIPSMIHTLSALGSMDIYNCTLEQWNADASLNGNFFPYLSYMDIVRTRLASFPVGLLDEQLPPLLLAIYFFQTNVTVLPPELVTSWRNFWIWSFEFADFRSVPDFILDVSLASTLTSLVFTGSPLEKIDLDLFQLPQLQEFALSRTVLQQLPNETLGNLMELTTLELEYTQLETVPMYIREWYHLKTKQDLAVVHSLYGSPYCEKNASEMDHQEQQYQSQACAEDYGISLGSFSMDLIEPQRPL